MPMHQLCNLKRSAARPPPSSPTVLPRLRLPHPASRQAHPPSATSVLHWPPTSASQHQHANPSPAGLQTEKRWQCSPAQPTTVSKFFHYQHHRIIFFLFSLPAPPSSYQYLSTLTLLRQGSTKLVTDLTDEKAQCRGGRLRDPYKETGC